MDARLRMAALLAVALAACTGEKGPIGPTGPPGTSTGSLTVMVSDDDSHAPIPGAAVSVAPGDVNAVTVADGSYTVQLPVGVYTVAVEAAGYLAADQQVSVVAGGQATLVFQLLVDITPPVPEPLVADAGPDRFQAGFGAPVTLDASGSSGPVGVPLSYAWTQVGGPRVVIADAETASPTFTTRTMAEIGASFSEPFQASLSRFGVLGFAEADVAAATYTFEVSVSDGTEVKTDQVIVRSVTGQPGLPVVGVDTVTVLNSDLASGWSWTCTAPGGGACAVGTLTGATGKNPAFRAPAAGGEGTYSVSDGTSTIELVAAKFLGARPVTGATTCSTCHDAGGDASFQPYPFWSRTRHATYFERAITGQLRDPATGLPVVYKAECIRCHTVGYNPEAASGGFDDVAAGLTPPWTLPPPTDQAWTGLPDELKSLASVACESCHGPGSQHGVSGSTSAIAKSLAATDCAQCHAKEPYEVQGLQWRESRHARFVSQASTGTPFGRPAAGDPALLDGSCAACHSAQGFVEWRKSMPQDPSFHVDARAPSAAAPAAGVAEPQTCATCHDPHGAATDPLGQMNFRQLRIHGYVRTAAPGVAVRDAGGPGALCITCHNGGTAFSGVNQAAPHRSCQADVLFGVGAQLLGGAVYPSGAHIGVPGMCVGCHMAPAVRADDGTYLFGGHTVAVRSGPLENVAACTGCHPGLTSFDRMAYRDYDGNGAREGVATEVAGLLAKVKQQLGATALALWPAEAGTGPQVVSYEGRIRIARAEQSNVCDLATAGLPDTCFAFPAGGIPQATPAEQAFLAASWNYFLVEGEGTDPSRPDKRVSSAMHNPPYAVSVLQRSYLALGGTLPPDSLR